MRFFFFRCILGLFLAIPFLTTGIVDAQNLPKKVQQVFTAQNFQAHIDFLASDAMLGRNTPSAGLDSAASYIANAFKKDGLQPVNGSYFESVPLIVKNLGENNAVELTRQGNTLNLKIKDDFSPFDNSGSGTAEGDVVFAGYGITAPEKNYDDYAGMDVKGKIVLILRHGPGESDTASPFYTRGRNNYYSNEYKLTNAIQHGAVGILLVTDPANHLLLTPRGFPWPSLYSGNLRDAMSPMLKTESTAGIPFVHIGKSTIEMAFGSLDSLKNIQLLIDKQLKPNSFPITGMHAKLRVQIDETPILSNNVVGFLPGVDPKLKDEILVIGGHYDHLGFRKTHKEGEDYIMNGADDNASGTTGVLLMAEAFSKMKKKPARSVLFITFSGEEKGLFGSRAYVAAPLFPLNKTIGMLNLDMISRNSPDSLFLESASMSPGLTGKVLEANKYIGFKLNLGQETYASGSDHASFYAKDIPFVFFFAGLHPDYHTVRDNPRTIDAAKGARVAKLAFETAWLVSNESEHYTVIHKK